MFKYPSRDNLGVLAKSDEQPFAQPIVQNVYLTTPNFIEGTHITHEQLNTAFPFGYAIFYYGQNKIIRNEVVTNGLMEWKMDVDKVSIQPDFYNGIVKWDFPANEINTPDNTHGTSIHMTVGDIETSSPFKVGAVYRSNVLFTPNKPLLYMGTLSDDQRNPIFVLGFRITTKEEFKAPIY